MRIKKDNKIKITILFDNETTSKLYSPAWGFSCLIEAYGKKILFDTGNSGDLLLKNMENMKVDLHEIDEIFISHKHWDHIDGLKELLKKKNFKVYLPISCKDEEKKDNFIFIDNSQKLHENIYTSGELNNIEQSLILKTKRGLIIIVGCSHPGVENILQTALNFGNPFALIGGFHDFNKLDTLQNLEIICPTHCSKHKKEIEKKFPKQYLSGGVGKIIEFGF